MSVGVMVSERENLLEDLHGVTVRTFVSPQEKLARLLAIGCRALGMSDGVVIAMTGDPAEPVVLAHHHRPSKGAPPVWASKDAPVLRAALGCGDAVVTVAEVALGLEITGLWRGAVVFSRPVGELVFDDDARRFLRLVADSIICELKQRGQQEALQSLSEWQRVILQGANLSIIATAPDGTILSFNRAAETMLGYSAEEMVGKVTPAILHDVAEVVARAPGLSREIGQDIAPGFDVFVAKTRLGMAEEREWTYIRKDGSRFPVLLSVTALRNGRGDIRGYLGIGIDLTLRKQLEDAAGRAHANDLCRDLIHGMADAVIGVDSVPPHLVRFLNPEAQRLFAVDEGQSVGLPLDQVMDLVDMPGSDTLGALLQARRVAVIEATVRVAAGGARFPVACRISPVGGAPGHPLSVVSLHDISERRLREQKLRLSDQVFEHSSEAIVVTDPDGIITSVNPAFTQLTGYSSAEAIGKTPSILKSGRHDHDFYAAMWRSLIIDGHWSGELWDRRKDGSLYPKWLTINALREGGGTSHYVAQFSDISERKANEERISYLARHDTLTGLPNRLLLQEQMALALARASRNHGRLALVFIDLDRFKNINDSLGHHVGDRLLVEVARRLTACLRTTDTAARIGGDEFVVLAENIVDQNDAAQVAIKIHAALEQPVTIDGKVLHAPPSLGISLFPDDGCDVETLMQRADTAMYQVKASGRNSWLFFTSGMNDAVQERLELEHDLRLGMERREFRLHFQPQWSAASGLIGWEALLRWHHPTRGLVPPDHFIPIAEDTGLILPLGDWVLATACAEIRRWEDAGLGRHSVGVNLSARQFRQAQLGRRVAEVLEQTALAPGRLELEITESVLMDDADVASAILLGLKQSGVRIAIDDFGTGYSSLAYLKSFAVDRLKIDRSFVRDITHDANDAAIVSAIISLAHSMGIDTIAEGVETEAQRLFLLERGCGEIQGYLLGRPMAADDAMAFLRQRRDDEARAEFADPA